MSRKQLAIYGIVLVILGILVYLQFRTWRNFDWTTFWSQTDHVSWPQILLAIALIYFAYIMRAIRWKIFLQPVRRNASAIRLIQPTVIGFTGLALLGRAGELIRPYLIARRESLSLSSQIAVWTVERIFDIGAFAIMLVLAIFFAPSLRQLQYYREFRKGGFFLLALVAGLSLFAWIVHHHGERVAAWMEHRFAHLAGNLGQKIALRIREFGSGLHTISDFNSFLQLSAVSLGMWYIIALAYRAILHSYGTGVLNLRVSQLLLLMGSSMLGSMVQLPGVGGGSQLATIATLQRVFHAPHELAASCGILLWLITFVSVVPLGLLLAHRERLSLRQLSEQSAQEEESAILPSAPPAT